MPEAAQLVKARLIEITLGSDNTDTEEATPAKSATVQFNPESLRVVYKSSVGKTDATGSAAMQFISSASTTLAVDLYFDATVHEEHDDVRQITKAVHYFVTPSRETTEGEAKFIIPAVRFSWGSFVFDGVVTGLNETLEFFSSDGRPLRSKIGLSMSAQDIQFKIEQLDKASAAEAGDVGQTAQTPVKDGQSMQDIAGASGKPEGWKGLAEANDIENPRAPATGQLLKRVATRGGL